MVINNDQQTILISLVALIVSLLSFAISLLAYRRDKSALKLSFRKRSFIVHARPPYKPKTNYTTVTATNVGRRLCTINHMGHKNLWQLGIEQIWGDGLAKNPANLNEGAFVTYLAEYEKITKPEWKKIAYFFVVDSTGRETRVRATDRFRYAAFIVLLWLYRHRPFKQGEQAD